MTENIHTSYRIIFEESAIRLEKTDKVMNDIHENGNFDIFKYQLDDKHKILIFYLLRNIPQEIRDKICESIDLAIDKYLLGIDFDENFYMGENKYVWDNYGA